MWRRTRLERLGHEEVGEGRAMRGNEGFTVQKNAQVAQFTGTVVHTPCVIVGLDCVLTLAGRRNCMCQSGHGAPELAIYQATGRRN